MVDMAFLTLSGRRLNESRPAVQGVLSAVQDTKQGILVASSPQVCKSMALLRTLVNNNHASQPGLSTPCVCLAHL